MDTDFSHHLSRTQERDTHTGRFITPSPHRLYLFISHHRIHDASHRASMAVVYYRTFRDRGLLDKARYNRQFISLLSASSPFSLCR